LLSFLSPQVKGINIRFVQTSPLDGYKAGGLELAYAPPDLAL
jgi:hypothetical protein